MIEKLPYKGHFKFKLIRGGKVIDEWESFNALTNEGKNAFLDLAFNEASQPANLYLGLIDNSGFAALAVTDTYDNINQSGNGWDEFTDYTDPANEDSALTRPEWTKGSASGQAVTNASPVLVDITGTGTIKGVFLCWGTNAATKGDHTSGADHTLFCTTLFQGGDRNVANLDQLQITYSVTL